MAESIKSLRERIDDISQEIMATAFSFIERLKHGPKITPEELATQQEKNAQFKILESNYTRMVKLGRIKEDKDISSNEEQWLDKVRQKESTMGDIVREAKL